MGELINTMEVEKIEDGFIIYTFREMLNAEKQVITRELKAQCKTGFLFFRTVRRAI